MTALAKVGEIGNGRSRDGVTPSTDRGASYLVRRLKRDAPEIALALARGEFTSARAAGIAAGIAKPPTMLSILRRAWAILPSGGTAEVHHGEGGHRFADYPENGAVRDAFSFALPSCS